MCKLPRQKTHVLYGNSNSSHIGDESTFAKLKQIKKKSPKLYISSNRSCPTRWFIFYSKDQRSMMSSLGQVQVSKSQKYRLDGRQCQLWDCVPYQPLKLIIPKTHCQYKSTKRPKMALTLRENQWFNVVCHLVLTVLCLRSSSLRTSKKPSPNAFPSLKVNW